MKYIFVQGGFFSHGLTQDWYTKEHSLENNKLKRERRMSTRMRRRQQSVDMETERSHDVYWGNKVRAACKKGL